MAHQACLALGRGSRRAAASSSRVRGRNEIQFFASQSNMDRQAMRVPAIGLPWAEGTRVGCIASGFLGSVCTTRIGARVAI
jgi:hypothetical protein